MGENTLSLNGLTTFFKMNECFQNTSQNVIKEIETNLNIKSLNKCIRFNCFVTDCLNITWELAKYSKLIFLFYIKIIFYL